jgi:receptor protein-tyrosine kinase
MELVRYTRALRRWYWLFLLLPAVAAIAATVVTMLLAPVYEARVSLLVRPAQPLTVEAGVATLTSDQISRTYAQLMVQRPLLERVISDLGLGIRPEDLQKRVRVTPQANTTLVDVSVRDTSRQSAQEIANTLVSDFLAEIKQIQQQEESRSPNSRSEDNLVVVSPAVLPDKPVSPSLPLNLALSIAAGLLAAAGLTLLFEYLDQSVKGDDDLSENVGLLPIAHIPYRASSKARRGELVALAEDSPAAEAYKTLRTNLLFSAIDKEVKTIVVTSPAPGEGKSRTAANLAVAFAEAGFRTVLIDADFRRPSQHRIFGRIRNLGLSNLILQDLPDAQLNAPVERLPNLWLITSGPTPPNPSELLGSGRFKQLLGGLRQSFSYVIIDTPPVNAVSDPIILAADADGTLVVVEQGRTTYPSARQTRHALDRVGARVLGAVVNKVRASESSSYYYQYGYGSTPAAKGSENGERASRAG